MGLGHVVDVRENPSWFKGSIEGPNLGLFRDFFQGLFEDQIFVGTSSYKDQFQFGFKGDFSGILSQLR